MDASAYLTRLGWTGGGLGYKQSGIKKPILASQKHGFQKGLGGKPLGGHSDQWWLGAFDAGLKSLGSDKPAAPPPVLAKGPAYFKAELYRNFVQGEGLTGTMSEQALSVTSSKSSSSAEEVSSKDKKKKKKERNDITGEKREKKRRRKEREVEHNGGDSGNDDQDRKERRKRKEERRARKEARRLRRAQRQEG